MSTDPRHTYNEPPVPIHTGHPALDPGVNPDVLARAAAPQQQNQRPSVGRVVHYVAYGTPGGEYPAGAHRAAIITEVYEDGALGTLSAVGLCILNPTGQFFTRNVPYEPTGQVPGTWHWPEFVPPRS